MTKVAIEFEKFPWFAGDRRPVQVSGTVLCLLTKITEAANAGDPCRVSFVIERVEFTIGHDPKTVVDFNGDTKDMEDFSNWLKGRYGITISNELRNAHLRVAPTTADA